MKKQIGIFTAILFAVSTLMVSCSPEVHEHTFAEEWSSDETNHWHAATCEHKDEVIDRAEHTFGDWITTKKPTEEAEGSREKSCTVCEYTVPEVIEKLEHKHKFATEWTKDETNHWHASTCGHEVTEGKTAHTFGDWITTKEATEEAEGSQERVCDVCKHKETAEIAKLEHKHVAGESWKKDDNNHWKECTVCKEKLESAEHEYEWIVTKEATCTDEGSKTGTCKVCKKEVTEKIDAKGHSGSWKYDDTNHWKECTECKEKLESAEHEYEWTVTKAATCTEEGSKTGTCKVCKKEVTEKIDAKEHSYSESWTKKASGHWYECVCCGAKKDFEEHTYGTWNVTTEPTTTQEGKNEKTCSNCGYVVDSVVLQPAPQGFRFVKGVTITGTESWTPESEVFVSGRTLTIPDLIVSDHEVTRGEYKAVMGSDPSRAMANDKDGKELEGDAVLNNPVTNINWNDAILYCNKLSMQEKLTPCYTINSSTNPDDWGKPSIGTLYNATCDFEANGYRLPTEAEWEWLARGGENYKYAGSDTIDDVAWYKSNTNATGTREVKAKAPNGYGLYDMSGNVCEWCWDWYGSISSSTAADGVTIGSGLRVLRDICWFSYIYVCPVADRDCPEPTARDYSSGFRVVRTAK